VAPEVLEDRVTEWTEQYSLAVNYYQLRTGRLPFGSAYARVFGAPDLSALPEQEREVVARALAKQPEERWPSCREFVRRLKEAVPSGVDPPTTPWLVPLGLAALACLVVGFFLFLDRGVLDVGRNTPDARSPAPVKVEVAPSPNPEGYGA